jgi:hypothetical protein
MVARMTSFLKLSAVDKPYPTTDGVRVEEEEEAEEERRALAWCNDEEEGWQRKDQSQQESSNVQGAATRKPMGPQASKKFTSNSL